MITSLSHKNSFVLVVAMALSILLGASAADGQTSGFTYQGRLTDGGTPANGNYDLQFALWNSLSGGAQVGSTQTVNTVAVSNGVFTVSLDFGANAFPGASRFLEISARPSGGGSFTLLSPRQQITSMPYAVRSLNAASADSVPASGVPSGSGNYIQNTASPQASSNFNISGNGTAGGTLSGNLVNATTQYNLTGQRILSGAGGNLFVGAAGSLNTTGIGNTFVGHGSGQTDSTGRANAFFGQQVGVNNTFGSGNAFFGAGAGESNTAGDNNTAIGFLADVVPGPTFNPTNATAIGANAQVTDSNALVLGSIKNVNGAAADTKVGIGTTSPLRKFHIVLGPSDAFPPEVQSSGTNTFAAGWDFFHGATGKGFVGVPDPSASFGAGEMILLGGTGTKTSLWAGFNRGLTLDTTGRVQIGPGFDAGFTFGPSDASPSAGYIRFGDNTGWKLHIGRNRESSGGGLNSGTTGVLMTIQDNGRVGIGTMTPDQLLSVNGNASKAGGGSWATFSDERLKNLKGRFTPGLSAVMRLQPLRYEYKRDNALGIKSEGEHIGFSAQAVQKIIPEAVSQNDKGYLLINNDPIMWTMLNAIKEQQAQIEQQQKQIVGLKKLVCRSRRRAAVCK